MRYIANSLSWTNPPHTSFHSSGVKVEGTMSHFSFGGAHGPQPLRFHVDSFNTLPMTLAEARKWAGEQVFASLVSGDAGWEPYLSELLGVKVPMCGDCPNPATPLVLGVGDWVLCVSYDEQEIELPRPSLSRLKARPDKVRFHLHWVGDNS